MINRYMNIFSAFTISGLLLLSCDKRPVSQNCFIPMRTQLLHALSLENHRLATVSFSGVNLWDVRTGENLGEIGIHEAARSVAITTNGFFVVSGVKGNGRLREYLVQSGMIQSDRVVKHDQDEIYNIAGNSNGTGYLMSFEVSSEIAYYRFQKRKLIPMWKNPRACRTTVRAIVSDGKDGWYAGCSTSEIVHLDNNGKIDNEIETGTFGVTSIPTCQRKLSPRLFT